MRMRRFTRLTNGFSKKIENLAHAVPLHYLHCNRITSGRWKRSRHYSIRSRNGPAVGFCPSR
jgi:hypothetical protein